MSKMLSLKPYLIAFITCFAIGLFSSLTVLAQKRQILTEEEQVQEAVTKEVEALFKSTDFLKKKNKKFTSVKGYIVVDISVVENGKLSSFFKVDTDIKDIDFIEYVSKTVLDHKFDFKLPKKQCYKIRQTVNIE